MIIANFNNKVIEAWWSLLKQLSSDIRLELAARLIESLKTPDPGKEEDNWKTLFGSWAKSPESAEDMINFINESRFTDRKIEPFN